VSGPGFEPGAKRVALVTGSSRGLGRVIGLRLARDGLAVAINALHEDTQALDVVDSIERSGGTAAPFAADVTDEHEVDELVAAVDELFGSVDVLVLNATGPQPEALLEEVPWEEHMAQLEFFVKSPVLLGRAVLPGMVARNWGRIVQIDSEVVDRIPSGRSAYVTAKSAQVGMTRSWARELASFGITVNAVAPGFVPVERHADCACRGQSFLRLLGTGGEVRNARGSRPRSQLLRLRRGRLHHRTATRCRRRPRARGLTTLAVTPKRRAF
jgi:3-oxoacyl-[acyl-carrier protein] reductase